MRMKAHAAGALNSNSQQKIETKQMDGQNVIIIQPANPPVVCVPSYNSIAVYGAAPVYPYPAMVYPPSTGAIVAASAISFGMGVALGAAFSGCCGPSWGWGCNWGPHSTVIVNNNFFGRYGYARPYAAGAAGRAAWAHNPAYRGAVPYSSAAVAGRPQELPRTISMAKRVSCSCSFPRFHTQDGRTQRLRPPPRPAPMLLAPRALLDRAQLLPPLKAPRAPESPAGRDPPQLPHLLPGAARSALPWYGVAAFGKVE